VRFTAAILTEPNGSLLVDEIEVGPPGRREALVRLIASGVCASQLHMISGPPALPMLLGHEASGVVVEVGDDVTGVTRGDHVLLSSAPTTTPGQPLPRNTPWRWRGKTHTGMDTMNNYAWSTHTLIDERNLTPIREKLPWDLAAILGCAAVTGAGSVTNIAKLREGETIAVFGVGGVGLCSVIAAAAVGAAQVIAVDIDERKLDFARTLGATHTVDNRIGGAVEAIRDISAGGVDCAVDTTGRCIVDALLATRPAVIGGGRPGGLAIAVAPPAEPVRLDIRNVLRPGRTLTHSYAGNGRPADDLRQFAKWYEEGLFPLETLITTRYPLDRVNQAVADLRDGTVLGRAIIDVG
jgi:Zn-dependent alcohol dehydrogenase